MVKLELVSSQDAPDLPSLAQIIVDLIREGIKRGQYEVGESGQVRLKESKITDEKD
jgi:hypothetical protein